MNSLIVTRPKFKNGKIPKTKYILVDNGKNCINEITYRIISEDDKLKPLDDLIFDWEFDEVYNRINLLDFIIECYREAKNNNMQLYISKENYRDCILFDQKTNYIMQYRLKYEKNYKQYNT